MTDEIVVLGADQQAATSLAIACPERRFLFVSDCPVNDGWDLKNVRFMYATPQQVQGKFDDRPAIALSARWSEQPTQFSLLRILSAVEIRIPGTVIPGSAKLESDGKWVVKGDCWHRPDLPVSGTKVQLGDIGDPHGCGLMYQPFIRSGQTIMAIGRCARLGPVAMGLFRVFSERHFRIDFIQAAETIDDPALARLSREVLMALEWDGWFTLNWIWVDGMMRLSSLRPVPKGVFGCFRRGGIDLLGAPSGDATLVSGLRMIASPHYSEFEWLSAS